MVNNLALNFSLIYVERDSYEDASCLAILKLEKSQHCAGRELWAAYTNCQATSRQTGGHDVVTRVHNNVFHLEGTG